MTTCSVGGCDRLARSRGLCGRDYQRARKAGTLPTLDRQCLGCETSTPNRSRWCNQCTEHIPADERRRVYKRDHDERRRAAGKTHQAAPEDARRYSLKSNYGLTADQHRDLFEACSGRCQICGYAEPPNATRQARLHVDHDHVTGEVRGLLCFKCNVAIGHLQDDPELVARALAYLTEKR